MPCWSSNVNEKVINEYEFPKLKGAEELELKKAFHSKILTKLSVSLWLCNLSAFLMCTTSTVSKMSNLFTYFDRLDPEQD